MSVVGFDFGNEFCKIAVARRRGIDVLQNEVGHRTTPSMVAFSGSQRFIGNDASSQYMSNASNTISQIKRFLGRSINDPELSYEQVPYKRLATTKGTVGVEVNYDDKKEIFSAEQIAGAIFTKLKGVAERGLDGTRVTDCVIGCPSYWTDQQRRAMLDAANIAGLNVLRLMNETTAVALNYGILRPLPKDTSQKVIFFDMGHSQTSASLVSFVEGKLEVLATSSDRNLGARNFDNMLIQHFASYIKTKYNLDVLSETKATLKLTKECQRVKNMLSANVKVPFNVEYIMKDTDVSGVIERAEFDALACKEVCPRIVAVLKKLMDTSGVPLSSVHSIEIVGGGVRIPIVQKTIQDWFGRDLSKTCDGDESVARGAALMCAMISPSFKVREFEVQDIFPYPIDLKWGPVSESFKAEDQTPLFIPNNPIPSVKLISFNDRTEPFQVVAEYAENSQIPPATPQRVGHFIISGMPSKQIDVKAPKIKVRVKLNTHGTLAVTQAQLIEEIKEIETKDEEMKDANATAPTPTDTTKDADKMETDKPTDAATKPEETKPATDAKMEEEPKKVKVKRTDLKIESFFTGGLDATTLSQYFEKECAMANQDRTIAETGEARNALESYVLEMRGRVQDGDLTPYTNAKEKDPFLQSLDTIESWLYGDGSEAQKSEYKNRLADLKKTGDAIVGRYHEHQQRPEFIAALKSSIGHYQQLASSSDEKYAHIDKSERDKILQETSSLDAWLTDYLIKQDKHPLNETPILTCDALKQKKIQLENMANPIMNKPKPAPPKVEEPKKEEPKKEEPKKEEPTAANAAAADGGATPTSGDGMDTKP